MADFTIKSYDRLPSIQATLSADLTTALSVDFIMRATTGGTAKVNSSAVIVSIDTVAKTSVVRYDWLASDTDTPGEYNAEWEVHWPGPKTQTFPTLSYHTVSVMADLDGAA